MAQSVDQAPEGSSPSPPPQLNFSFASAGWLKMYLFGVAKALQQYGFGANGRFIGSSAGALTATGMTFDCDFDKAKRMVLDTFIPKTHESLAGAFRLREYVRETLLQVGNLHKVKQLHQSAVENQLTVVYSSLSSFKSRRATHFEDEQSLLQALLASCCATPIAGFPFRLNNEWVFDGGLFDFQPMLGKDTVTVNPFYCWKADIRPSRYVPLWWAVYPPSSRDVEWLFDLGYEDALHWIVKSGLVGDRLKKDQIPTKAGEYDGEWTTTLGRVTGYRFMDMKFSRFLDVLVLTLIVCIWKPLAFFFLYAELWSRIFICASKAAVYAAAAKFMVITGTLLVLLASSLIHTAVPFVVGMVLSMVFLAWLVRDCGGLQETAKLAAKEMQLCLSCIRSVASLSLFLRAIPLIGSSFQIKHHDFLLQYSIVYRLVLHAL